MDIVLPEVIDKPPGAISEVLDRAGVVSGPASLPVEFRLDEETFRRDVAELPRAATFAAAIGVKTMFRSLPASSQVPATELLPTLRRRVSACASVLREHGIDFAIEVIGTLDRRLEAPHEFIWRLPDGADFAESCDAHVGLLVDSWHWHHSGGTVQDIIELGNGIFHVHLADAADIPDYAVRDDQRLLPDTGVVDFRSFLGALTTAGYSGFISPEIRGYRCSADPVDCARTALRAVQACLDDVPRPAA
jgi:sugar phosphate isomerase/epimerase